MRLLKSQQLTRAAVRMRDAEGVFFAPGKITEDMEVGGAYITVHCII